MVRWGGKKALPTVAILFWIHSFRTQEPRMGDPDILPKFEVRHHSFSVPICQALCSGM